MRFISETVVPSVILPVKSGNRKLYLCLYVSVWLLYTPFGSCVCDFILKLMAGYHTMRYAFQRGKFVLDITVSM